MRTPQNGGMGIFGASLTMRQPCRLHVTLCRSHARNGVHYGFQMLGGFAATSAYDAHTVLSNKTPVVEGKFGGGGL